MKKTTTLGVSALVIASVAGLPGGGLAGDYPAASAHRTITGTIAGDQLGRSVAIVGDVNNDGFDDYAIGSRGNDPNETNAGRVYVYSGATGGALCVFDGEAPSNSFGEALAGAGDVDNDGQDDIIIGAWANSANGAAAGRAYVYSGRTGEQLYVFTGEAAGDNLGDSVGGAGDVNNDGFADVIVGAPTNDMNGSNTGRAYVHSGADGSLLWSFEGIGINDRVGISVNGAGYVNADAFADVIVGAHLVDEGGLNDRGKAWVYSGADGSLLHEFTGEGDGDNFGWDVAGAGDVNADGVDDLLVGAPLSDALGSNTGRVYVYSGLNGAIIHLLTAENSEDKLGLSVSPAGDVNGDGYADVLAGSWWNDAETGIPSDNRGRAYVYSGLDGTVLHTVTGEASKDHLGRPVAGGGDLNNDGAADILVGARDNDAGGLDAGQAYVFFLPPVCLGDVNADAVVDLTDLAILLANFGMSGAALSDGDVNGDGEVDLTDLAVLLANFGSAC